MVDPSDLVGHINRHAEGYCKDEREQNPIQDGRVFRKDNRALSERSIEATNKNLRYPNEDVTNSQLRFKVVH